MSAAGLFEAYCNGIAHRTSQEDATLLRNIERVARGVLSGCRIEWSGSVRKSTSIRGSDLDLHVHTNEPVTESQRRHLRTELFDDLGRTTRIGFHAVRIGADAYRPGVDLAFSNAAFGSRVLPDFQPWHGRPVRQQAVRGLKTWLRSGGKPAISGWMIEELVLFRELGTPAQTGLELFERVVSWLASTANPSAIEAVLRPKAQPRWQDSWSKNLPGRFEAVANTARQLRNAQNGPATWRTSDDIGAWLGNRS
jgi:hypothetical protein